MTDNDALKSLAEWDLLRNKDNYPADALDANSCFYNGQVGNCGVNCICYINGDCQIEDEIEE